MANSNISSIGRFSSQMLTYLGTQRTVRSSGTGPVNTYKYSDGDTVFLDPGNVSQSEVGTGVVGSYSAYSFDSTKCYFISRGASAAYADTMAGLAIDMAATLGISPQSLLEQVSTDGKILFTADAYRALNTLRDPGNQVGIATTASNRLSLLAREIRS